MGLSSISFGALSTDGKRLGTEVMGVDVNKYIEDTEKAGMLKLAPREKTIELNDKRVAALKEQEEKLSVLKTAVDNLRNDSTSLLLPNLYDKKAVSGVSDTLKDPSSLLAVSISGKAVNQQFNMVVKRIATYDKIAQSVATTDPTTALNHTGTLTLNGVDIAVTAGMSLNALRDAINFKTSESEVQASVLKLTDDDHRLVLKATETGKAITLAANPASLLTDLNITTSGKTDTELSAELTVDGLTVIRAKNTVEDLLKGVTFDLKGADPATTLSFNISEDLEAIQNAVVAFKDAWNEVIKAAKAQRVLNDDGTVSEEALLYRSSTIRSVISNLPQFLTKVVVGISDGQIKSLSSIGLTLNENSEFDLNTKKLEDILLAGDLTPLKRVLGFVAPLSNESFVTLEHPSALAASLAGKEVTLSLDRDGGGVYTATFTVDGVPYEADVDQDSLVIRGKDEAGNTLFKGFELRYIDNALTNGTSIAASFTPTQGIADLLSLELETFLAPHEGTLVKEKESYLDANKRQAFQLDRQKKLIEKRTERLRQKFQEAEKKHLKMMQIMNTIQAEMDARNGI